MPTKGLLVAVTLSLEGPAATGILGFVVHVRASVNDFALRNRCLSSLSLLFAGLVLGPTLPHFAAG